MASGDLSNQVPIIPGVVKHSLIGAMPGHLPESQQRHWIPDERDNFISWLRGEFAAANAIIDSLCHHLQLVGKPGEYDFVLTCIQQRRYNWTVVLHMQQYFSVAEVVYALNQVVWLKQTLNSDHSGLPPLFVPPENGGGSQWKEGPITYRDPRGEHVVPSASHPNCVPEEQLLGRKETPDGLRSKSEDQCERRGSESGDRERQRQPAVVSSSTSDSLQCPSGDQTGEADQSTTAMTTAQSDLSFSEQSPVPLLPQPADGISDVKEEEPANQGSQRDFNGLPSHKSEASEEKASVPYFHIPSKEEEDRRLAALKITKSYKCMEQVESKMVNVADGLELYESVLDTPESNRLASLIQHIRPTGKRGEYGGNGPKKGGKGRGREVLLFGHSHFHFLEDHKKRSSSKDDVPPVPDFLEAVIDRLVDWHVVNKRPDCCSISFLEEGDYLPPHFDNSHLERPYCTLALQSECTLTFGQSLTTAGPGDFKGPLQISLPVGSVLLLQKSSADVARHSISISPSKRIIVTMGKVLPGRPSRGHNHNHTGAGFAQSPPRPFHGPSPTSWGPAFSHNNSNRQGNASSSNLPHNTGGRGGGGGGFSAPYKSRNKYAMVSSSAPSSSGGVLPNPTARPPPPGQIIPNVASPVPPLFTGTPGPPTGAAFPPPPLSIPSWAPLQRPPPSRGAGTGVFLPSSGASSGPGRPVNVPPPRRSSNNVPSGPPLLQKTNSAPASFASLEASAIAAAAAVASPSTPPGKSSKQTGPTTSGNVEKITPITPAAATSSPRGESSPLPAAAPQICSPSSGKANSSSDPDSGSPVSKGNTKEDSPAAKPSGRISKSPSPVGNSGKAHTITGGGAEVA